MKLNIITVGNFKKDDPYMKLFDEYKKRIKWNINLIEIKAKQLTNIEEQKNYEAELIKKYINKNNTTIVLDERGDIISTTDFEKVVSKFELKGDVDFVIGGAYGLNEKIRNEADYVLSFGKMVFPHLMVRVLVIEQLYRVWTLKNNHPYHK